MPFRSRYVSLKFGPGTVVFLQREFISILFSDLKVKKKK